MIGKNSPSLWLSSLPRPKEAGNKYDRGHCIVIGSAHMTGAARLAAAAAARAGAGLVTLIAPVESASIYRAACPAHIIVEDAGTDRCAHLQDPRRNALVLGPGHGRDEEAVLGWLKARATQRAVVDADALDVLSTRGEGLALLRGGDVLTPHAGEYGRLFGDMPIETAARAAGCVVLLKGALTRLSDGARTIESRHATPYLASAGTGDVLAGLLAGLLAQGMPSFEAACAAAWIHGEAGLLAGAGLVAEDLPGLLPQVFKSLT